MTDRTKDDGMTAEQMARLASGDFDCHDYVEINVGGTGPNQADFETLDTPGCVIRELATKLTTLQQEKAALEAELAAERKVGDDIDAALGEVMAERERLREALEEAGRSLDNPEWIKAALTAPPTEDR
jgi:septal ring factor EnvC (AmiA/AmiB activator)